MNVWVVDYGMGNLPSVGAALNRVGARATISADAAAADLASHVVLPGVGSFREGMAQLEQRGLAEAILTAVARGVPLLGVCLGMQLLADWGGEGGGRAGLGLITGKVCRIDGAQRGVRVPHSGWNEVRLDRPDPLMEGIPDRTDFYFVHSFHFVVDDVLNRLATTDYGGEVTAAVRSGSVMGTQFHPEKSSRAGEKLLSNFLTGAWRC